MDIGPYTFKIYPKGTNAEFRTGKDYDLIPQQKVLIDNLWNARKTGQKIVALNALAWHFSNNNIITNRSLLLENKRLQSKIADLERQNESLVLQSKNAIQMTQSSVDSRFGSNSTPTISMPIFQDTDHEMVATSSHAPFARVVVPRAFPHYKTWHGQNRPLFHNPTAFELCKTRIFFKPIEVAHKLPQNIVDLITQKISSDFLQTFAKIQTLFLEIFQEIRKPIPGLRVIPSVSFKPCLNISPCKFDNTDACKHNTCWIIFKVSIKQEKFDGLQIGGEILSSAKLMDLGLVSQIIFSNPDQTDNFGRKLAICVCNLFSQETKKVDVRISSIPPEWEGLFIQQAYHRIWIGKYTRRMDFLPLKIAYPKSFSKAYKHWKAEMMALNGYDDLFPHCNMKLITEDFHQKFYASEFIPELDFQFQTMFTEELEVYQDRYSSPYSASFWDPITPTLAEDDFTDEEAFNINNMMEG